MPDTKIIPVDELTSLTQFIEHRDSRLRDTPILPPTWYQEDIDYAGYFLDRLKEIWEEEKAERRVFGPLDSTWEQMKQKCPACRKKFKGGDFIVLAILGPGTNKEARALARENKAYNAIAIPVHNACRYGDEDNKRET